MSLPFMGKRNGRPRTLFPELEGEERKRALYRYHRERYLTTHREEWNEYQRQNRHKYFQSQKLAQTKWYQKHKARAIEYSKKQDEKNRVKIGLLLGTECFCCGEKDGLEVHHLTYPNGKHFTNPRRTVKEVFENSFNFRRVCFKCHMAITHLTAKKPFIPKIVDVVRMTITS